MNPEHAAEISSAAARRAPRPSCSRQAVAGKGMAGVMVATRMRSRSMGSSAAASSAFSAASSARVAVSSPALQTRRSEIPVRDVIHSSLVSTSASRSALRTVRVATAAPVPRIRLRSMTPPLVLGDPFPDTLEHPVLDALPRHAHAVLDSLGRGSPVTDDHHPVDTQERGPAVLGVIDPPPETLQQSAQQEQPRPPEQVPAHLALSECDQHRRRPPPHLERDIPGEPVADYHIGLPVEDIGPLHITDKVTLGNIL